MKLELRPEKPKGLKAPVRSEWGVDWTWSESFRPVDVGGSLLLGSMYDNVGIRTYAEVK